jgi:NAD(P)H-hydrate epimerase
LNQNMQYLVHLDLFTEITKELPAMQLERALKFGAQTTELERPDVWIDAYLGFSQRLPLGEDLLKVLNVANASNAVKISLDIPSGFIGDKDSPYFKAEKILSLAAPKKILYDLQNTEIYVADLGIPKKV